MKTITEKQYTEIMEVVWDVSKLKYGNQNKLKENAQKEFLRVCPEYKKTIEKALKLFQNL